MKSGTSTAVAGLPALGRELGRARERVVKVLDHGGPLYLVIRILRKLSSPIADFGSMIFLVRDLSEDLPAHQSSFHITLRQASLAELPLLLEAYDSPQAEKMLRERFSRGDIGIISIDDTGKVANCYWATRQRAWIPELQMELVPGPGEVYTYDGYTRPGMRARRIFAQARVAMYTHLRAANVQRAYASIRGDNLVSRRAAGRWIRPTGRVRFLRLKGLRSLVLGWRTLRSPRLEKPVDGDRQYF